MEEIQCAVDGRKIEKGPCGYTKGQITDLKPACSKCPRYQKLQELGFDPVKGFPLEKRMGFVCYPPDGIIPIERLVNHQLMVSEKDIDLETFLTIRSKEDIFKHTKNPLAALAVFMLSHEAGLYPPTWAIGWFVKAIKEYDVSHGKKNLAHLLGIQRGRDFKKLYEDERDEPLMFDIFRLNHFLGYSVREAATMVSRRLKKTPDWNKTGLNLRIPSGPTLEKEYSRKWRSIFEKHPDEIINKWSEHFNRIKKNYLKLFARPSKTPSRKQ